MLTPLVRRLASRAGIIDHPRGAKIHTRATPLMGGVAMFVAFAVASFLVLPPSRAVIGVLAGGLTAVVVGLMDERLTLPPLTHLAGQVLAALIAMTSGVGVIHTVNLPSASLTTRGAQLPLLIGFVITLVWLVGMMNTVNFLDGLDGLAAGIACLAALLLAFWASESQRFYLPGMKHHEDLLLPIALAGAILGFLVYNWHPARIFMGDSGSMFLGLTLGTLSIVGPAKLGTALLVLMIPVLDVAWAIVRRRLRGRNFLSGDKQHVYHRMLDLGLGHTSTVLLLYFLCFILGVLDLLLYRLAKLIAFLLLAAVTWGAFVALELRASRRAAPLEAPDVSSRRRPLDPGLGDR